MKQYRSPQDAFNQCGNLDHPTNTPIPAFYWQSHKALEIVKEAIDEDEIGFARELLNLIADQY